MVRRGRRVDELDEPGDVAGERSVAARVLAPAKSVTAKVAPKATAKIVTKAATAKKVTSAKKVTTAKKVTVKK